MKRIKLTRGKYALADDEDFEFLSKWKWYFSDKGYAVRTTYLSDGQQTTIRMHSLVLLSRLNQQIDHANRDKLDNQKFNLRFSTQANNCCNAGIRKDNISGFKGVSWCSTMLKWRVQVQTEGAKKSIGNYENKEDAARAYNEAAIKYHGEFAYLNEVPSE